MTGAPPNRPNPTRRRVLGAAIAGTAAALAGCHHQSHDDRATADADEAARTRSVAAVRDALAQATALAAHRGTPPAVRKASADLSAGLRAQLRLLGGDAPRTASGTPTAARSVPAARRVITTALADVPTTSGPMARLLTCVAAGAAVRSGHLASAAHQTPAAIPRASTLPPLDNDDLLPRIGQRPPIIGEPLTDDAATALAAFSTALRTAEYGYGVVAARTRGSLRTMALDRMGSHRRAALSVDTLALTVLRTMPAAQLSYPVPPPVGADAARSLARRLELDVAFAESRVIADLATTTPGARGLCADHLVDCALAASRWGVTPALPGMSPG